MVRRASRPSRCYLQREGVEHGEIGEWPACHVAPYVSISAIASKKRPDWVLIMGMRTVVTLLGVVLLSSAVSGQDRLVVLGTRGPFLTGGSTALVEADVAGTAIRPSQEVLGLPFHGFWTSELVAVAGGRYLAWIAAVGSDPFGGDCQEYVVIADRRLRSARVVPDVVLPCGVARLAADRRRPRVFLHTWATVGGLPGVIASIDEDLIVRPIVVSNRLGTAFAYAPEADQLFVTERGAAGEPTVAHYRATTGERVGVFSIPDYLNTSSAQMQVTADGRRAFLWTHWGALLPYEQEIRLYDVATGIQQAGSWPVYLDSGRGVGRFVVDNDRNLLLVPHTEVGDEAPYPLHILAFDATTLALLGSSGGYTDTGMTFRPLRGRGSAAAYLLARFGPYGNCQVWVDAFDATGAVRTRTHLSQFEGDSTCIAAGVLLSPPRAPSDLIANVSGRHVTLTWTDPGDTSEFELEAGVAPGRRDLAVRVGRSTTFAAPDVPPGTYYVRVRAINEIGTSPPSNELAVVVQ